MADYRVTDTELTSIANAIRTKGATQASLEFPTGFVTAIDNIPTGREPILQSKTVTENGTVTPDQGYDGLSDVTVNVEGGAELVGILKYGKTIFLSGTNKLVITASSAYQTFFVLGQKGVMGLITEMNGGNPQTNLSASSGTTVSATAKSALSVKVSISGSNTSMNVYSAADFSVSSEA